MRQTAKNRPPEPVALRPFLIKGIQTLVITRADAAALTAALRAAIPGLRFVARAPWRQYVDWVAWRRRADAFNAAREAGLPAQRGGYQMRDPYSEPLRYFDGIDAAGEHELCAWVEPPGWRPIWSEPCSSGTREIVNRPGGRFFVTRAQFMCLDRDHKKMQIWFDDPPPPLSDRECILLRGSSCVGNWDRHDAAGKAFVHKAFRILRRLTIDRVLAVWLPTGRPRSIQPWEPGASYIRIGHDAARWSMGRRHNYLTYDEGGRLVFKPPGYPYDPSEVQPERPA